MRRGLVGLQLFVLVGATILPLLAIQPVPPVSAATGFAAPAFQTVWTRTDQPVEDLSVRRTWLWGPQPLNTSVEPYVQSPNGERRVQYFDKSRMEINNPGTNAVTNGLLSQELISGRLQKGDDTFDQLEPAQVNVAGDPDDTSGPTYASLGGVLDQPALPVGTTITETIDRVGATGDDPSKAGHGVTAAYFVPETEQSVASVFWDFLQTTGEVQVGASRQSQKLFDPTFFATGLPTSRAYWARVKVAGVMQDVLIQAFERRVLTYTPANPEGFRVEMGNVGRHYYRWRYGLDPAPADEFKPRSGPHIGYGFNGFFTFNPQTGLNDLRRSLDLVKGADFDWIRQQVVWTTLQPRRPQPGRPFEESLDVNQLATYDAIVREAVNHKDGKIQIMFSIVKSPCWAVASDDFCRDGRELQQYGMPADPQTFAQIAGFLADKYKGAVVAYEIWNEQNLSHETGGRVEVGPYIALLKAGYAAIKAADDRAIVVYGGLSPTGVNDVNRAIDDAIYLEQSYQYNNGEMRRYFDVLGAHPGSNNNPPDAFWPEIPGPGTGCPEADGKCWQQDRSFYFRRIEQLRDIMVRYGDANKQMWLTEFGWSTKNLNPAYGYGSVIREDVEQRDYIKRAFEKGQQDYPWMGVMFLWTLNHSVVVPCSDEKYPWSMVYGKATEDPSDPACREVQPPGKQPWEPRPAYNALRDMPKPR